MPRQKFVLSQTHIWIILGLIWLGSNVCDRLWLILDHSIPAWDQSNHLSKSLQYVNALTSPQLLDGEWWRSFWMLSTKYPPITYILGAFFQIIFGLGNDQALLTNLLYSAILIISVYTLGKTLFSPQVGLWGAGLSMLFPRLYQTRLQFLLDTPLMTFTIACFCCLTLWKLQKTRQKQWLWTVIFGLGWGLALLTKQSIMFFLITPLLWLGISYIWQRKWERILQLIVSFIISSLLWFPWYRTNWIYLFSTVQNSNAIPATYEGDPPLNTLAAWTYYWQDLPLAMGWVLLIVPLVGLLLHLLGKFPGINEDIDSKRAIKGIKWLGIYFVGSYFVCSAIFNKDTRYIMSYLPILAIVLGYFLTLWRGKWEPVRWISVMVAIMVMITNLFPISGTEQLSLLLSPGVSFRPYLGQEISVSDIIKTVQKTTPYQIANLGVIANTDSINHNTLNYYGQLANFQVYGRELGNKEDYILQDSKSFDWFVSKTGDNGFARDNQLAFAKTLENNPNFSVIKTWEMPDKSWVNLYQRKEQSIIVESLPKALDKIRLDKVIIPAQASPNYPIPITYEWSGNGQDLKEGIVLLSWYPETSKTSEIAWIHDHGIGKGMLYGDLDNNQGFKVIENLAMLPDKNLTNGDYKLRAMYLNRKTNKTYLIPVPDVTLTLDNNAPAIISPELDLGTQLREISLNLAQGMPGLDTIFSKVGRFNQYDPIQDYLKQTEIALNYRLENDPGNHQLNWTYGLVLSQVLQEDPQGAIAALKQLIKLDPNNPYHHAYLAFIYLYNWQPKAAETALRPALEQQPKVEEFQALAGISAVMQGNFIKGWQILSSLLS
ncbi:phospholipid carrier-dependent glycosyltransferase [Crocosphaera sp. XPORK-15E]|uniref:phospholipid carrier-dependent glycosyltransferase n=1 Tax=Crocosphaera sp. XPORK-15E TaxID=3110247 RepID=UPI002B206317|nr:phospholipid carrier-dependent glycosyltransferase [Crocosphaera sp. XPORK-15E]MEA5534211.1 phospholipid carrier-dependent glycosyltransferase [Crocosphaera sp. XPORK-15E]